MHISEENASLTWRRSGAPRPEQLDGNSVRGARILLAGHEVAGNNLPTLGISQLAMTRRPSHAPVLHNICPTQYFFSKSF